MFFSIYDPKIPFFLLDVVVEAPLDFKKVYDVRGEDEDRTITLLQDQGGDRGIQAKTCKEKLR